MEISQAASHLLTMFETVYYCNLDLAYATAIATYRYIFAAACHNLSISFLLSYSVAVTLLESEIS